MFVKKRTTRSAFIIETATNFALVGGNKKWNCSRSRQQTREINLRILCAQGETQRLLIIWLATNKDTLNERWTFEWETQIINLSMSDWSFWYLDEKKRRRPNVRRRFSLSNCFLLSLPSLTNFFSSPVGLCVCECVLGFLRDQASFYVAYLCCCCSFGWPGKRESRNSWKQKVVLVTSSQSNSFELFALARLVSVSPAANSFRCNQTATLENIRFIYLNSLVLFIFFLFKDETSLLTSDFRALSSLAGQLWSHTLLQPALFKKNVRKAQRPRFVYYRPDWQWLWREDEGTTTTVDCSAVSLWSHRVHLNADGCQCRLWREQLTRANQNQSRRLKNEEYKMLIQTERKSYVNSFFVFSSSCVSARRTTTTTTTTNTIFYLVPFT